MLTSQKPSSRLTAIGSTHPKPTARMRGYPDPLQGMGLGVGDYEVREAEVLAASQPFAQ
jgi:hypothetical protein